MKPDPALVGRVVLGTADLSFDPARDRGADIATLRAGLDAGATIVDTARAYARTDDAFYGEKLTADAAHGYDRVIVGTKGTHSRVSEDRWDVDLSPDRVRSDVHGSLEAMGTDRLDLYYLHRVDLAREQGQPVEVGWPALAALKADGLVQRIGLSNVTIAELETASAIAPVDAVQNQHRAFGTQSADVLAWCERNGVAYFAYSPLRALFETSTPHLAAAALERGVTVQQLVLRALLASSPVMSVISGATRIPTILDSVAAQGLAWDDALETAYRADVDAIG